MTSNNVDDDVGTCASSIQSMVWFLIGPFVIVLYGYRLSRLADNRC
jgi:hypothetical protein